MTTFRSAEVHNELVRSGRLPGEEVEFNRPEDKIRNAVAGRLDQLAADTSLTDAARKQRRAKVLLEGRQAMAVEKAKAEEGLAGEDSERKT